MNTDPNRCACGNRKPINRAACTDCICPECNTRPKVHDAALCHACRDIALGFANLNAVEDQIKEPFSRELDPADAAMLHEPFDREGDVAEGAD